MLIQMPRAQIKNYEDVAPSVVNGVQTRGYRRVTFMEMKKGAGDIPVYCGDYQLGITDEMLFEPVKVEMEVSAYKGRGLSFTLMAPPVIVPLIPAKK
jgi:hypothetical protein